MTFTPSSSKFYPTVQVGHENGLPENHTLKKQLSLIGRNKRVIDFGCATGYFAQLLKSEGCRVVGVEVNPNAAHIAEQYCERVIVADLDVISIPSIFPEEKFDVVVFGDVLEHLRDPWHVLGEAKQILEPGGYVVASIPNVAHGAVRLALLQGRFEYAELGLLDNTHLRFFTRKTVQELFGRSGYVIDVIDRTTVSPLSDSPLVPRVDREMLSAELIRQVEQAEDSDTLQFVLRAFPVLLEEQNTALALKYSCVSEENIKLQSELLNVKEELEMTTSQLAEITLQFEEHRIELQINEMKLQENEIELRVARQKITDMESSRLWELKRILSRLQRLFRL